jgi:putative ABC transport system permease protein
MMRDVVLAFRRLRRSPGFTLFSVVTLALGVGATSATYSVMYDSIWRPAGVRAGAALVAVSRTDRNTLGPTAMAWPDVQDLQALQRTLSDMAVSMRIAVALSGGGRAETVNGEVVSGRYFQTLGVEQAIGRLLLPSDDALSAPLVCVLADSTWRRQFAADPGIVGRTAKVGGRVVEIVGVAPASFRSGDPLDPRTAIWVTVSAGRRILSWIEQSVASAGRRYGSFRVIGRLGDGRTIANAAADIQRVGQQLDRSAPVAATLTGGDGQPQHVAIQRSWSVVPLTNTSARMMAGDDAKLIVALPALVLLIACTNLANLVLSRGASRRHEMAVRRALGASRTSLVRELVVEHALVAGAGGFGGVLVAVALLRYMDETVTNTFGASARLVFSTRLEPVVFFAALFSAVLAIAVSGLVPALQLTRVDARGALGSENARTVPRWRGRANLIALQLGVSVGLFLIAALSVREIAERRPREGLDVSTLAVAAVPLSIQPQDAVHWRATIDSLITAAASPDADMVAASTELVGFPDRMEIASATRPFAARTLDSVRVAIHTVTPGAFAVFDRTFTAGRPLDQRDVPGAPPAIVICDGLARALFGRAAAAIGQEVLARLDGLAAAGPIQRFTVAGVIADAAPHAEGRGAPSGEAYRPLAQAPTPDTIGLFARTSPPRMSGAIDALRTAVRRVDSDLATSFTGRADLLRGGARLAQGLIAGAAGLLAGFALMLSMTGLYGVLSHVVASRTREMGVRLALGATTGRLMRLVFSAGLRPVVEGLAIGLLTAVVLRGALQLMMSESVQPVSPLEFALAAALLMGAGVLACYLPARRAARVNPNVALRDF